MTICGAFIFIWSLAYSTSQTAEIKQKFQKAENDSIKVDLAFRTSKQFWNSNPDSARYFAEKGLHLAKLIHYRKGEADCLNSLSAVFWMNRNYAAALDYTLQNLTIRQELGDTTGIFNASNNLGLIYYETAKYDLALRYSIEALSIANVLQDEKKRAKACMNLGLIYYQLKDTSQALLNYNKSLELNTKLNNTFEISYVYYNLGELYLASNPNQAFWYYQRSLSISEKLNNKELIAACLQIMADEKRKEGKLDESLKMGKKALAVATEINNLKIIDLAAQTLHRVFLAKKNFQESLRYYVISDNARDSMLNEKELARMSELKYNFDLNQKTKQIEVLERDKIIAQKNAQNQKLMYSLGILGLVFTGIIFFGIYRNRRIRSEEKERALYEKMLIAAKEKAEENDRLKTAFLCNMSHEIRTPMNAIIGFTDLLISKQLPPEKQKRYTNLIKERSVDLLQIIEDILDISRIEVGQVKLNENATEPGAILAELLTFYKLKISSACKGEIHIEYKIDQDLTNTKIIVDAHRLKQILGNLLDNALKFTSRGFIEYGCTIQDGNKLLFYVKDSGSGIPSEKLSVIFERFRQADEKPHIRNSGGAGLGLSIVKGLLLLMKGEIWVESAPGEGSTFYFTIPLKKQDFKEVVS